jgi:hypothetical protein
MELLGLSAELLLLILGFLGPEFFADDLRRLTLCQRWYPFARQILHQRLHLSLLQLPIFNAYVAQDQYTLAEIRRCAKSVDIWVPSVNDWLLPGAVFTVIREEDEASNKHAENHDDLYWSLLKEKVQEVRKNLSDLMAILDSCLGLRSFRICAHPDSLYLAPESFMPFVHTPTLARFLSLSHITSLELDVAYLPNDARDRAGDAKVHFCALINSFLPRLRRLRYRMATVCEQLLVMPRGDAKLDLEELIINLGFFSGAERATFTSHCKTPVAEQLQIYIRSRVRRVVARLKKPRVVGVVWYEKPSFNKYFFNAVTGNMVLLPPDTGPWAVSAKSIEYGPCTSA